MKHWIKASFVVAAAVLVIGEVATRVFFSETMSGRFEYGYHPTAGFQENGDGTVELVRAGGRRFRPQSFQRHRPDGTFRVMVVGDSVPRGASLEGAYPWLVGNQLRSLGVEAESFNLAVAGYGAHRNFIVTRQALEYEPSLVVLHMNNSNEYEDEREYKRAEQFKSWHPKNWVMKSLLLRRLYELKTEKLFWELVPTEIRSQEAANDADAEIAASVNPEKLREWDERVRKFTEESVQTARARGVPILLVTQARSERGAGGGAVLDDHGLDVLAKSLKGNGVYHVSMKQVFQSSDFVSLFADSAHLRPVGHEMLATAIVNQLQRDGLVNPRKPVQSSIKLPTSKAE